MRSAVLVICLAAVAGCVGGSSPEPAADDGAAAHELLWREAGLESYRYDFQQQCFCVREQVQPVTIEVREGRVDRVISRETGEDLSGDPNLRWPTVPELFAVVAEAEANGTQPRVLRYDPELGYPTHVELGSLAADAGVIYSASNLEPL